MVAAKQELKPIFYSIEDEPPPEALIEMYKEIGKEIANAQTEGALSYDQLCGFLSQADSVAAAIEKWATEQQKEVFIIAMQDIRQALQGNHETARQLFRLVEKYGAVQSNADAVITQQLNIIDEMAKELESLKLAINQGKTTDSRLEPIVKRLRSFVEHEVEYTTRITASLERIDEMAHYIRYLNPEMDEVDAYLRATRLSFIVNGSLDKPQPKGTSPAEREAFLNLVQALEI
jgi:predicted RNase H-like nuclease (RuvC/YqgF family)